MVLSRIVHDSCVKTTCRISSAAQLYVTELNGNDFGLFATADGDVMKHEAHRIPLMHRLANITVTAALSNYIMP